MLSGVGRRFFKLETLDRGARARVRLLRPSSLRRTWSPRSARAGGATAGGMEPALTGGLRHQKSRRRFLFHGASRRLVAAASLYGGDTDGAPYRPARTHRRRRRAADLLDLYPRDGGVPVRVQTMNAPGAVVATCRPSLTSFTGDGGLRFRRSSNLPRPRVQRGNHISSFLLSQLYACCLLVAFWMTFL